MLICMSAVEGATSGLLEEGNKISNRDNNKRKKETYSLETDDLSAELPDFKELLAEGEDFPL